MTELLTYTVEEASKIIPLGINQTYAAVRNGEIPCVKIGRRILIPRQRLLAWLNGEPTEPENSEAVALHPGIRSEISRHKADRYSHGRPPAA